MWGERQDNACYLHRLAVDMDHHNQQIGRKLLHWMEDHIVLSNGYLRLDCVAANPALNSFYQRAGFTFAGYIGEGADKFSTYEKPFISKA
jgi:ribosomal protein S18 acetylase RimI-like enzyme